MQITRMINPQPHAGRRLSSVNNKAMGVPFAGCSRLSVRRQVGVGKAKTPPPDGAGPCDGQTPDAVVVAAAGMTTYATIPACSSSSSRVSAMWSAR